MNTISADVSEKIKSAIKAKLMELGAFVDEELPDYIMVLVCDKRDKAQLEDDLKLFLGASTEKFTSWLDQVISKLEEVSSTSSKDNKKSSKSESKKRRSKDGDDDESDSKKGKKRKSSPSGSKEDKRRRQSEKEEPSLKRRKISETETKKTDDNKVAASTSISDDGKTIDTELSSKTLTTDRQDSESVTKAVIEKPKVVLMQSDDDDDDEDFLNIKADAEAEALLAAELDDDKLSPSKSPDDEHIIEEPVPEITKKAVEVPEEKPEKQVTPTISFVERSDERPRPLHSRTEAESSPEISTAVVRPSHISLKRDRFDSVPRVRQLRQIKAQDTAGPLKRMLDSAVEKVPRKRALLSSRVVAPAKTAKVEEEEEEYDPLNPAVGTVASIVRVKPRPKIPPGLQANKTLLLKAVADAHKSVANFSKRTEPAERPIELHTRKFRENIAVTVDTGPSLNTGPENAVSIENVEIIEHEGSTKDDIEPYTPEPLSKISARLSTEGAQKGTQFFVTLHGVDKESYQNDKVLEEEVDLEEYMEGSPSQDEDDEVFKRRKRVSPIHFSPPRAAIASTQASLPTAANLALDDLVKAKLSSERCRFWPSCRQGDKCLYHHPNTPCKQFPNCKFGDKCLFIHPNCKYDASCTRRDCPYTHASPRIAFAVAGAAPVRSSAVCRFFPKCANPGCQFLHPKPCRYGQFCTKRGCTYQHDPTIPTVNQLKWSNTFRA